MMDRMTWDMNMPHALLLMLQQHLPLKYRSIAVGGAPGLQQGCQLLLKPDGTLGLLAGPQTPLAALSLALCHTYTIALAFDQEDFDIGIAHKPIYQDRAVQTAVTVENALRMFNPDMASVHRAKAHMIPEWFELNFDAVRKAKRPKAKVLDPGDDETAPVIDITSILGRTTDDEVPKA